MPDKFRIYSTEITPTLDPDNAEPAPITNIALDQDPHHGVYEQSTSSEDRGSVITTLGGVVIQDFGVNVKDEVISFSDEMALTQATITALNSAYEIIDGQWYFTDGYECWKVQFSRVPRGFESWRSLIFSENDFHTFSYSINLIVVSKEI